MNNFFNTVLTNVTAELTFVGAAITMGVAILFGVIIAFTYYKTQEENYQRSKHTRPRKKRYSG